MKKDILITGAGLVGSLLSIYLSRRGYRVKVLERRGDMRLGDAGGGRSINLALSDRGIRALEAVGVMDEIRDMCIPMHGRFIHNADGTTAFQPYGKEGQFINSVSRAGLNRRLMDLAASQGVQFFFNERCQSIHWQEREVVCESSVRPQQSLWHFDLLFGADGAFAASRLQHQLQHDRFQYQQYYIDYGYRELSILPDANGGFRMEKNALHIWPRGNYMLIALPNIDGSFTCTLFLPFEGDNSFASLKAEGAARTFFDLHFPDASAMMPELEKEFEQNPVSSLVTVRCYPWVRQDHFALIGDAAHAIVPFFGQGMNCGFEDCRVLNELLDEHKDDWEHVLLEYQEQRKPDADAIAELALLNFIEMRDRVADPRFLLQKKIEALLHQKDPSGWIPAYTQVTFSPHIRYSEALKKASRQEAIMQEVMQQPDISEKWDDDALHQSILARLRG